MTAVDGFVFDLTPSGGSGATHRTKDATLFNLAPNLYGTGKRALTKSGFFMFGGGATPPPPPVVTYYRLAATDTGVGRRYWTSTTRDFASAPSPIGAWVTSSLTVQASWQ